MNHRSDPYAPPTNLSRRHDYNRSRMTGRPISEGREVNLQDYPEIGHEFERMGWLPFLYVNSFFFPILVREFYSNFEFTNEQTVRFRMFEWPHEYTLQEFGILLGVPYNGRNVYHPSEELQDLPQYIPRHALTMLLCRVCVPYRLILRMGILDDFLRPEIATRNAIIMTNMYHRDPDVSRLSMTEACIHWCMTHNIRVNIAHLVASRMNGLHYAETRPLPYGAFLNRLFTNIGMIDGIVGRRPLSTLPIEISFVAETSAASSSGSENSSTRSDARSHPRHRR